MHILNINTQVDYTQKYFYIDFFNISAQQIKKIAEIVSEIKISPYRSEKALYNLVWSFTEPRDGECTE